MPANSDSVYLIAFLEADILVPGYFNASVFIPYTVMSISWQVKNAWIVPFLANPGKQSAPQVLQICTFMQRPSSNGIKADEMHGLCVSQLFLSENTVGIPWLTNR